MWNNTFYSLNPIHSFPKLTYILPLKCLLLSNNKLTSITCALRLMVTLLSKKLSLCIFRSAVVCMARTYRTGVMQLQEHFGQKSTCSENESKEKDFSGHPNWVSEVFYKLAFRRTTCLTVTFFCDIGTLLSVRYISFL